MSKRKLIALVLAFAMVVSMSTACGRSASGSDDDSGTREKTTRDNGKSDTSVESTSGGSDGDDGTAESSGSAEQFEKGQELSAFVTAYTEAKSAAMDKLTKKMEDSGDLSLTMSLLGFAMMDLTIAFVPMFDVVDETGFIPFLNIRNAFKKTKGNLVTFGADYKVEEDGDTKGDRIFWDGKLDVKDDSLSTVYYTERGGRKISKTVIEITKNKDGSYTSETITYSESEEGVGKINGVFVSFEGEDMWLQMGDQANAKPEFDYVTVFNKKNVDIKDLSKDFVLSTDISYVKGTIKDNIVK